MVVNIFSNVIYLYKWTGVFKEDSFRMDGATFGQPDGGSGSTVKSTGARIVDAAVQSLMKTFSWTV